MVSVVFEMHCHFAEDPAAQVDSVIKILRGGEDYFCVLDVSGIQVHGAFHDWEKSRHLLLELIRLPLDFW